MILFYFIKLLINIFSQFLLIYLSIFDLLPKFLLNIIIYIIGNINNNSNLLPRHYIII